MGEVYRARDTKLDRDVAIKVLPESVAAHTALRWNHFAQFLRDLEALRAA